eukprot:8590312-Pyramimonas_sp.AAC.1
MLAAAKTRRRARHGQALGQSFCRPRCSRGRFPPPCRPGGDGTRETHLPPRDLRGQVSGSGHADSRPEPAGCAAARPPS